MKIQIPHSPGSKGETGGDLWLTTDPLGRVVVGVVGAQVTAVDPDTLIAALEAINQAEDLPMDHPANKPPDESDPAS